MQWDYLSIIFCVLLSKLPNFSSHYVLIPNFSRISTKMVDCNFSWADDSELRLEAWALYRKCCSLCRKIACFQVLISNPIFVNIESKSLIQGIRIVLHWKEKNSGNTKSEVQSINDDYRALLTSDILSMIWLDRKFYKFMFIWNHGTKYVWARLKKAQNGKG